jgi:hypothetical protein
MAKGNRYRLYEAEKDFERLYFSSPEAAQGWLSWVCRTKWWKDHSTIKYIDLNYPTYSMSGSWKVDDSLGRIDAYAFSLDAMTLCHEMAHLIDWRPRTTSQEKCHDAHFAGTELAVIARYMGADWRVRLEAAFLDHGVKWEEGIT